MPVINSVLSVCSVIGLCSVRTLILLVGGSEKPNCFLNQTDYLKVALFTLCTIIFLNLKTELDVSFSSEKLILAYHKAPF